ncbi:Mitochondrial phosphate carrier protein like [Actinidia chinensis var. chinensis]|uniref:Mitochondrial phosphate carrier protein like n=1 Tax=Actinidia chinensis var. chinensis TaxID=1590841 RepID=A0A2R6QHD8_ACTCC|nr:Mitochondrial phosphate carrier protein like [Actinidia chinensis var. chinensis]
MSDNNEQWRRQAYLTCDGEEQIPRAAATCDGEGQTTMTDLTGEVIADIALCPFKAVKVRVQPQTCFARGMSDGFPKFIKFEGALGSGTVNPHFPYLLLGSQIVYAESWHQE